MKKIYKVLSYMLQYDLITDAIAKEQFDIEGLSQIISTLRDRGFNITSVKAKFDGAAYTLNKETAMKPMRMACSQEEIVMTHLLAYGSISNDQAMQKYGIKKLSTVIDRIRDKNNLNISVYRPVENRNSIDDREYIYVLRPAKCSLYHALKEISDG